MVVAIYSSVVLLTISHFELLTLAKEQGGTIEDLFTNENSHYYAEEYVDLRDRIGLDEVEAEKQMKRVKRQLEKQLQHITRGENKKNRAVIPETTYLKIANNGGKLPEGVAKKVKKRGVLIVRNTISHEETDVYRVDLIKYLFANNAIHTTPNQTVYEIYWSKSQIAARQHPNMLAVQKALLDLWHTSAENEVDVDLSKPRMYVDRLRIRQPRDSQFNLPPHIDGGGVERWLDPTYRKVYRHILEGNWEKYDPFEVDYRVEANMNDIGYANGCTFFRAFQGWLSLSHSGPGQGTLKVLPLLKESTAYWMLRPFLNDVPKNLFPGCFPGKTFHISQKWHPLLHDQLISIPKVGPGDTVWWHADLIHAVESDHKGDESNVVFYIPAGPDCRINRDYLRRMRHSFVLGNSPPDFPVNNYEKDFSNRATISDLSNEGKTAAGWDHEEELEKQENVCKIV